MVIVAFSAEVLARKFVVPRSLLVMLALPAVLVSVPLSIPNVVVPPPGKAGTPGLLAIVALPAVLVSKNVSVPSPLPVEFTTVKFAFAAVLPL